MKIFFQTLLTLCLLLSVVAAHKLPSRRLLAPPPVLVVAKPQQVDAKFSHNTLQLVQRLAKGVIKKAIEGKLAPPALVKARDVNTEAKLVTKSSQVKHTMPKGMKPAVAKKGETKNSERRMFYALHRMTRPGGMSRN
jgi:hypothetical protein